MEITKEIMKKLQNNFTTPEQSKRLLELGVPADSADCVRVVRTDMVFFIQHGKVTKDYLSLYKSARGEEAESCWSVGRLIEIFSKCYTGAKCYYSPRNLYKTEFWIERFDRLSKIGFINFSKLED